MPLVDEDFININKEMFSALEEKLKSLILKYKELEAEEDSSSLTQRWYNLCNGNYGRFRRSVTDYLEGSTIIERVDKDLYSLYFGRLCLRVIEDFVNAFEYILNLFFEGNEELQKAIEEKVSPIIELINDTDWNSCIKTSILKSVENKKTNFSTRLKILEDKGYLTSDDGNFLRFLWSLRNSMHTNFINTYRIKYLLTDDEVGNSLDINIPPGEGIHLDYTPKWYFIICERLNKIMEKLLERNSID